MSVGSENQVFEKPALAGRLRYPLNLPQLAILHVLFSPEKKKAWYYLDWSRRNKEKLQANRARWRKKNPDKAKACARNWWQSHPDINKSWVKENKERVGRNHRLYWKRRRKYDPAHQLERNYRKRIWDALKSNHKSAKTEELLGCSKHELKAHIQSLFKPGMDWSNYGPVWHVDHKKPCAKFDLSKPEQQRECFHFSNLQPLFAVENIRKGAK